MNEHLPEPLIYAAWMRALQDRQRMQVLSRPQVMTLDNQPAFVQVGARVPRITATTSNQNGVTNSVVLENVGILLGVTPRTSPDGLTSSDDFCCTSVLYGYRCRRSC